MLRKLCYSFGLFFSSFSKGDASVDVFLETECRDVCFGREIRILIRLDWIWLDYVGLGWISLNRVALV